MVLRLLASSLLLGLAAGLPVLDDISALVQRQQRPSPTICTPEAVADFHERQKAFQKRIAAKGLKMTTQIKQKFQNYVDTGKARGAEFLTPVLDVLEVVSQYLDEHVTPAGLNIVKGVLQKAWKGPLVPEGKAIDVNRTVSSFLVEWRTAHAAHLRALLNDTFVQLHGDIDRALEEMREAGHVLVPHEPPYPVHDDQEFWKYMNDEALPVIAAKSFPVVEELAELFAREPTNDGLKAAWVMKEFVPFIAKKLPLRCRPERLATTVSLGMGDVGARIGKFINNCKADMGLVSPHHGDGPKLKCSTCAENYKWSTIEGSNPSGCMSHCLETVKSCIAGVNNECIHKLHPCLRCHKRQLDRLDSCRGTEHAAPLVALLGKLEKVFKIGTVEKDGVVEFADAVLDTLSGAATSFLKV